MIRCFPFHISDSVSEHRFFLTDTQDSVTSDSSVLNDPVREHFNYSTSVIRLEDTDGPYSTPVIRLVNKDVSYFTTGIRFVKADVSYPTAVITVSYSAGRIWLMNKAVSHSTAVGFRCSVSDHKCFLSYPQ